MKVIDPLQIRHVTVFAGKIDSMSGLIDPASHLNLDFPDHKVTTCIIAEKFEKGASVKMDDNGMIFATVDRSAYQHYGMVDYTQRLTDMISVVKKDIVMESLSSSTKKKRDG
jgi:methyl coenzyme M reductase gamma subunit